MLRALNIKVWLDKSDLKGGEEWERGFVQGLVNSRVFVCLLSKSGLANFSTLTSDSNCDNVLLEHRLACELHKLGFIEQIFPVFIGGLNDKNEYTDFFVSGKPTLTDDVFVSSVENKLQSHMNEQGLGTPLELNLPIKATLDKILSMQGVPLSEGETSFQKCIQEIQKVVLSSSKKGLSTGAGANNNNNNTSERERLLLDANSKLTEEINSLRLEILTMKLQTTTTTSDTDYYYHK